MAVPLKTDARDFFQFLQQQGYLRVWLNGEVVRADTDKNVGRLGARVQVIQDRIAISEEARTRLVESLETALRFGKERINIVPIGEGNVERPTSNAERRIRASLLDWLALRALRFGYSAAYAGTV